MFIQLQVYWRQDTAWAPKERIGSEIFDCHDAGDLWNVKAFCGGKRGVLVFRVERDEDDICSKRIDMDELIREQEATEHHDRAAYNRQQSRKLTTEAAE